MDTEPQATMYIDPVSRQILEGDEETLAEIRAAGSGSAYGLMSRRHAIVELKRDGPEYDEGTRRDHWVPEDDTKQRVAEIERQCPDGGGDDTFRSRNGSGGSGGGSGSNSHYQQESQSQQDNRQKPIKDLYAMHENLSYEVTRFLRSILSISPEHLSEAHKSDLEHVVTPYIQSAYPDIGIDLESMRRVRLPLHYTSLEHYKSVYAPLILYDTWSQFLQSYSRLYFGSQSLSVKLSNKKQPCPGPNPDFTFVYFTIPNTDHFRVCRKTRSENYLALIQDFDNRTILLGLVTEQRCERERRQRGMAMAAEQEQRDNESSQCRLDINIQVYTEEFEKCRHELDQSGSYRFVPIYYLKPTIRLIETMALLELRPRLLEHILQPSLPVFTGDLETKPGFRFHDQEDYNELQQLAIVSICNAVKEPDDKVLLVQGPPGTGKTYTLMGMVKNLLANNTESQPFRIMICAPSNGAVDEIARRLILQQDYISEVQSKPLRMVRIGQRELVHEDVRPYLLENQVDEALGTNEPSMWSAFRDDVLLESDIILSTLASTHQKSLNIFRDFPLGRRVPIQCLIVDEAAQCSEPELLMPFIYSTISKVVLIGDHLQLPATVISFKAAQYDYGRSLFERFFRYFRSITRDIPVITLTDQFRMHSEICHFPSNQFYSSMLRTEPGTGLNPLLGALKPYVVFDVKDATETTIELTKANMYEADVIVHLLDSIFAKLLIPKSDLLDESRLPVSVAVITFYRGQKQALIRKLREYEHGLLQHHVEVNTVDGYQGQERDIILLSCVRALEANAEETVGFVRSAQRMNVALTRAKAALYVCISGQSFYTVPGWDALIEDARDRQLLVAVSPDEARVDYLGDHIQAESNSEPTDY